MPRQHTTQGPYQLVRRIVEVNAGARQHPRPNEQYQVQGNVEQVEDHPGQRGVAGRLQGGHRRHLLHDEESGVHQDEGVSRDVVAVPVEAGPPAPGFGCEFLVDDIHGVSFKA